MPHTRRTFSLTEKWDLTLNDSGAIAIKEGAEATAQAVANECRLWTEDAYFIQDRGTPYRLVTFGRKPNATTLRSYLRKAAARPEDVKTILSINVADFDPESRTVSGDIQFKTVEDEVEKVYF